jgi:UDP-GlcNAc:undecaprenyl-phosphate GlcNAc-1-phosphate transferase
MMLRDYGVSLALALAGSMLLTLLVREAARRRGAGWVAKPRADRWHRKPTALYGGVGIFGGFIAAYLLHPPPYFSGITLLVLCASGMFVLGLIDDRYQLKPYAKLVGQITLATLFTLFGLRLHWLPNPILDQGLSIFWLVGVTNALNLLDNIDGAAGGIAAIAALFMVYFCHEGGRTGAAMVAVALCGGCVGFLFFNFNPASIFMGDCGSLFLGFTLGGLALATAEVGARRSIVALLALPVLLLLIPIVDTTLVTVSRRYHGRRVSQGGRDHTSHRLVALGLSERAATLTLWTLAAVSGGVAVMVESVPGFIALGLLAAFAMVVLFLMIFLGRVKVYEGVDSEAEGRGRALLPTLADFTYKRRIFEVLNDLAIVLLAYYSAFLLRFGGEHAPEMMNGFINSLPVVLIAQLGAFLALGLYRGVWRYTGLDDLQVILKAVAVAVGAAALAVLFLFRFERQSRAVFVIDGALLLLGIAGTRVSFRLLRNWLLRRRPRPGRRVLIYGAGDGGELLLRELSNNHAHGLVPVGFLDDDPQKAGRLIHGVRVLGPGEQLPRLLTEERIDEVLISTERMEEERLRWVSEVCGERGLGCRRMRIALE